MILVKFFKYEDGGSEISHVISCPHYSVYRRSNENITVTVYKTMTMEHGIEWQLSTEERDFTNCYIENSAGKTIDRLSVTETERLVAPNY